MALRPSRNVASRPLDTGLFQEAYHDLALVIDLRSAAAFADGHIPGAICLPALRLGASLGSVARLLFPPSAPLLLSGPARLAESGSNILTGEGFSVLGYLDWDVAAWKRSGKALGEFPRQPLATIAKEEVAALIATRESYPWERAAEPVPAGFMEARVLVKASSLSPALGRYLKAAGFLLRERSHGTALWVRSASGP